MNNYLSRLIGLKNYYQKLNCKIMVDTVNRLIEAHFKENHNGQ